MFELLAKAIIKEYGDVYIFHIATKFNFDNIFKIC